MNVRDCSRGSASDDKGDYGSSIAECTESVRLDPKDAESCQGRGLVYSMKGETAHAEEDFAQAKKLGY
jgi:Flp pilus assembly protein TadD